jgi:hypothetical protein
VPEEREQALELQAFLPQEAMEVLKQMGRRSEPVAQEERE